MRIFRFTLAGTLILTTFLAAFVFQAAAAEEKPVKVYVDTSEVRFEVQPLVAGGTTLVQFRPLFEAMGLTVDWDEEKRIVTGTKEGLTIHLHIDAPSATVNGKQVALAQSARISSGSTMVPLRFIGEATGAIVHWDRVNREITIITDRLLSSLDISREEMQKMLDEYDAKQNASNPPTGSGGSTSSPEASPSPDSKPKTPPVVGKPVNLSALQGMYYGLRDDFGGYECGGACWDIYTFLPDHRIFVGAPPLGGPETIDCAKDGCSTYTISEGKLKLSSGSSYTIGKTEQGNLLINDIPMTSVKPVAKRLKLQATYKYINYQGLVGINAFSSSWTEYLTFSSDGTFSSTDLSLSSLDVVVSQTNASGSKSDKGTYQISGNTLILTYSDGTVARRLFFDHNPDGAEKLKNIQIGSNCFYIPDDE